MHSGSNSFVGRRNWIARALVGVATTAFAAGNAAAQDQAPPQQVAQQGADSSANSGEIIVTAQKRQQRVQDVPASVSVLSSDTLQSQGLNQLSDYAKITPGLRLIGSGDPGEGMPVIRGISTGSDRNAIVGSYLDDVSFTPSSTRALLSNTYAFDPSLADIDHIEVLKGPQATLYGANSLGGLIKYVTKQPDLTQFGGTIRIAGSAIDGGNAGYDVQGTLNIPIVSDEMALKVSGVYRKDPGYVDDAATGQKNINTDTIRGGSASLLVRLSNNLTTKFSGFYQQTHINDPSDVFLNPATLKPLYGSPSLSSNINAPITFKYESASNTTVWSTTVAKITNIASYGGFFVSKFIDFSGYNVYLPIIPSTDGDVGHQSVNSRRYSDELRLESNPGRLEWLLGGFYTSERDTAPITYRTTDATGVPLASSDPLSDFYTFSTLGTFREKAVFGDLTYHVTPKLEGTAGIRYSANNQYFSETSSGLLGGDHIDGKTHDSSVNYLFTVTYKPDRKLSIYARAASAYRPGGPNDVANSLVGKVPLTFGPDTLWNYEVGAKGSLLDGRLSYDLAAYHIVWSNIQIQVVTDGFSTTGNAAKAKADGVEASVSVVPTRGLNLAFNGNYSNARLETNAVTLGALKGDQLPYSPKVTISALADYRTKISADVTGSVGATFVYTGAQNTGFSEQVGYDFRMPSWESVDLRAGVEWAKYSMSATITNVTNKYALLSVSQATSYYAGFPETGRILRPRTYGLSFSAKF